MEQSVTDSKQISNLILIAWTDRIDEREIFLKGIDYSDSYEEV